jgi:predicted nucleotidyltransferase
MIGKKEDLNELITKASEILKSFGATEVYLFGSATTEKFTDDSDIDLAVSGLPPADFYKALGRTMAGIQHSVDLIDLDEGNDFVKFLRTHGELHRVG